MGVVNYYSERLKQYGPNVMALGWGSLESQQLRFKVLSEIADLSGQSVLDFGCGFGDLYAYIPNSLYFGYDNDPRMMELARAKYPGAVFTDFLQDIVEVDYVLASGTFNLECNWKDEIGKLWRLSKKGMAVNFTSELASKKTPGIVYADPFDTARFCSRLTRNFVLRHDYRGNDFTIYAYKETN